MADTRTNTIEKEENDFSNYSIITEQGDLGLGTRELTEQEKKLLEEQKKYYGNNR